MRRVRSNSRTDPLLAKDDVGLLIPEEESLRHRVELLQDAEQTAQMGESKGPTKAAGSQASLHDKDSQSISDHDHIFWIGDTNARLHWPGRLGGMPIEQAKELVMNMRFG